MAAQAPVTDPLRVPLTDTSRSSELQYAIYKALWLTKHLPEEYSRRVAPRLQPYFRHYERQCENMPVSFTHWHVIKAVECLRDGNGTKATIQRSLRAIPDFQLDDKWIEVLIHLSVRVWLMISVGKLGSVVTTGETLTPWAENESLKAITDELSSPQHTAVVALEMPMPFKAVNLERQADIRFFWTSNLADHLLLTDDDGTPKVHIFHHASFLKQHLEAGCVFLPRDFLQETLRTLALLFPHLDDQTWRWYHEKRARMQSLCELDTAAIECGPLNPRERQIDSFQYWRDRLISLKRVFDDTEPRSILGLWRDDRRTTQWYTFWIAVLILTLTICFGLIQSITGIVQAWVSVKGFHNH